jgi:predicted TIM-barrel fold metal-dependent hydrolase
MSNRHPEATAMERIDAHVHVFDLEMGGTAIAHHRYVTQCVRQWPDRFVATGLVDLNDPDPGARLQELVEATGIAGLRLMGALGAPAAERPEQLKAYALFERANKLGLNVNLYCPSTQVPCIKMLVRAFPLLNVSLDHLGICPAMAFTPDRWGRPRFEDEPLPPLTYPQILDLARYPNVYVKVSGEYAFSKMPYPYEDMVPLVERIYEAYGPERMMWCSDFPWIVERPGYQRLVDLIDHHLPSIPKQERERIMGGNALRIWFKR